MKKRVILFTILWAAIVLFFLYHTPEHPARIETTKVVALEDLDDRGKRLITVEFETGYTVAIETYVPFFYKVGDTAFVATHERYVFPDVLRIVSSNSAN